MGVGTSSISASSPRGGIENCILLKRRVFSIHRIVSESRWVLLRHFRVNTDTDEKNYNFDTKFGDSTFTVSLISFHNNNNLRYLGRILERSTVPDLSISTSFTPKIGTHLVSDNLYHLVRSVRPFIKVTSHYAEWHLQIIFHTRDPFFDHWFCTRRLIPTFFPLPQNSTYDLRPPLNDSSTSTSCNVSHPSPRSPPNEWFTTRSPPIHTYGTIRIVLITLKQDTYCLFITT